MPAKKSPGDRLDALRQRRKMSYDDVWYAWRSRLPDSMAVSRSTIVRAHQHGADPDWWVIANLAEIYDVPVEAISDSVKLDLETARDVITRVSAWITGQHPQLRCLA